MTELSTAIVRSSDAGTQRPDDPIDARLAAAAAFLRLRDFSPLQALELRLEAARSGRPR